MDLIAKILGELINLIYSVCKNYGLTIIIFTLFSKIILFPLNILIQKNSIKMIKIKPKIEELKFKYAEDKEKFMEEQIDLFEREKYKPSLGIIPLLIQIPIILGLVKVIQNPNIYIKVLNSTNFLSLDLTVIPSIKQYVIIPILSACSCLLLCYFQNLLNVLQKEEGIKSKIFSTALTTILTIYFTFIVPVGVGIYWIVGNLLSILQMVILNAMYPPNKFINYKELEYWKKLNIEKKKEIKDYKAREKQDYKKFFKEDNKKIVFYSEQNGFYKYFSGIIEYLLENSDLDIHYVTSDSNDKIFGSSNNKIKPYYIGKNKLIYLFMKMDAELVIMTTPDLQKYYLKRSLVKDDIEYIYLDHGMNSLNLTLRTGALDYYDTIFATGPEQVKELKEIEELRNTKSKRFIEVGFPFMDSLIKEYNKNINKTNKKKTILIAPSYQEDNILESCIDEILLELLQEDYKIIIRPHPQFIKRDKEKIDKLLNKYKEKINDNFYFELDFSSNESIYLADLVITDWSGIGIEYALSTTKPVLYINTKMKIINKDYNKIKTEPLDIKIRNIIGKSIEKKDLKNIKTTVKDLVSNQNKYKEKNEETRKKYLFNLGNSSKIAAEYIIKKVNKKGD